MLLNPARRFGVVTTTLWSATALLPPAFAQEQDSSKEDPPSEEVPATDDPAPEARSEGAQALDALRAELDALRARIRDQDERLERAETQLVTQRKRLAETRLEVAKKPDLTWDVDGHYRLRGHIFGTKFGEEVRGGLYNEQPTSAKFMNQRIRMQVNANYKEGLAKLHVGLQGLDNVVWGDNSGISNTPLFAQDPSMTRRDLSEAPPFELFRAWTEVRLPIGVIQAGRMSSHWGLGLLANDGDGFDDDFGENYFGNQFDRVLFATNPVSIAQAIAGKPDAKEVPLIMAVGVDRLVEGPLQRFYGYRCRSGVSQDSPDYDPRCDSTGDGTTDLSHGNTETRTNRGPDWWADSRQDVWEMLYVLMYRGKNLPMFGTRSDLTAGGYVINRIQRETDSNVVIGDIYLDWKIKGFFTQFEGLGIWGRTRALDLPAPNLDGDPDFDPLAKTANIFGYVLRTGYENERMRVLFESGYASGDDNPANQVFRSFPLHPDHNVGLLLYQEIINQVTFANWTGSARGLASAGGVYNSHYIFPRVSVVPFRNWQVIGGFLMAWPDRADGSVFRCNAAEAAGDRLSCTEGREDIADALGWEIDLAIKHRWYDHILFSLEMGYAHATNRLPLERSGLNPAGNFWTLQSRLAWEF